MSTTSMRSRASCFASASVPAMPTTSMSGSAARMRARESVNNWWSSTRSTRVGFVSAALPASLGWEGRHEAAGRAPIVSPSSRRW